MRPRTPTNLRILQGNPGKRPIPTGEPQPVLPEQIPAAPDYLNGYANDEWARVAPELYRLGLLTIADISTLASYCLAYGRWRDAEELLAKMASDDPVMRGLMLRRSCGVNTNPLVLIARKAANDMMRYAAEFGLTPAARTRLATGPDGSGGGGKFAGLLAG